MFISLEVIIGILLFIMRVLVRLNKFFKCRCGAIKSKIKKVPLPDTEEFKALHESDYDDKLEDDVDDNSFFTSYKLIALLIFAIVTITLIYAVLPSIISNMFSMAGNNTSSKGLSSAFLIFISMVVVITILSTIKNIF